MIKQYEYEVKTHDANYLGKCRDCEHWTGAGLLADDNQVCEISELICPRFCAHHDKKYLVEREDYEKTKGG